MKPGRITRTLATSLVLTTLLLPIALGGAVRPPRWEERVTNGGFDDENADGYPDQWWWSSSSNVGVHEGALLTGGYYQSGFVMQRLDLPQTTSVSISWKVRLPDQDPYLQRIALRTGDLSYSERTPVLDLIFRDGKLQVLLNGQAWGSCVSGLAPNVWHSFEYVIDWSLQVSTLTLDGEIVCRPYAEWHATPTVVMVGVVEDEYGGWNEWLLWDDLSLKTYHPAEVTV